MADFYFGEDGDIKVSPNGDIAITENVWRDDSQQAYIRVMTEPGDFLLYPDLGANLEALYGMPQSEATANLGKEIIQSALNREGRFQGRGITVNAVPTSRYTIRFDIYVRFNTRDNLVLQIEQDLGVGQ